MFFIRRLNSISLELKKKHEVVSKRHWSIHDACDSSNDQLNDIPSSISFDK